MADQTSQLKQDLEDARVFFSFAWQFSTTDASRRNLIKLKPLELYIGKRTAVLEIRSKDRNRLGAIVEDVGTYVLAMEMNEVLKALNGIKHTDPSVQSASQIVSLIRNAFAHGPFAPKWEFKSSWRNRLFEVRGIIKLDTNGLDSVAL